MIAKSEPEAGTISRRPEYTAAKAENRSHGGNEKVAATHQWTRLIYFGFAAGWGFLCGAVGLAGVLSAHGHSVAVEEPLVLLLLLPALAVAFLGGAMAASAYREARRRKK